MTIRFSPRLTVLPAALALAVTLGGCVVYPAYPTYDYRYPPPSYSGGYYGGYYGGGWRR